MMAAYGSTTNSVRAPPHGRQHDASAWMKVRHGPRSSIFRRGLSGPFVRNRSSCGMARSSAAAPPRAITPGPCGSSGAPTKAKRGPRSDRSCRRCIVKAAPRMRWSYPRRCQGLQVGRSRRASSSHRWCRLGGRHLRLYARSTAKTARVVVADSMDDGMTWSPGTPIDVPNPNSGIDAVALRDGRVVLIYNDTTTGRTPLNLAVSRDGLHFSMFKTLESEPGEYSYPALIQATNGDLEMTYTWNRKSVRHVHVPLAEVPKEPAIKAPR